MYVAVVVFVSRYTSDFGYKTRGEMVAQAQETEQRDLDGENFRKTFGDSLLFQTTCTLLYSIYSALP